MLDVWFDANFAGGFQSDAGGNRAAARDFEFKTRVTGGSGSPLCSANQLRPSGQLGRDRSAGYFHFPEQFEEVCFAHASVFLL